MSTKLAVKHACLPCRDFSEPDSVGAQYPRHTLPRHNPTGFLAAALCDPFASHTDKARAIFTWCHHNIDYDASSFFCGKIQRIGPDDTIHSGKAVCQGYAEVFREIATKAGLECVLIIGSGKGYGHKPYEPGDKIPLFSSNHAWNAVRIDGGEWKLLDSCWGAGHVTNEKTYKRIFSPVQFTSPNDVFGNSHFPTETKHFFRTDGRTISWQEYYIGPLGGKAAPQIYSTAAEEGILDNSVTPQTAEIPVHSGEVVRFQFCLLCEHFDPAKHAMGAPYLYMLKIQGRDGRKEDLVPMKSDGYRWWADVNAIDLGAPGQNVLLQAITLINGQPCRGLTYSGWKGKRASGRVAWNVAGIVGWKLV